MQKRVQMSGAARGHEIVEQLRSSGGSSRVQALAESLGVTEETIRRNVKRMSADGLVHKVHGAVHLVEPTTELSFSARMSEAPEQKRRIAEHVARLIPDGASLILDTGSTTAYIARALRARARLFVVTNSVAVAHALAARNDNRVFMPGGELRAHDGAIFGVDALDFVSRFQTDFAVLSAAALDASKGVLLFDLEEAKFARAILGCASRRILAADSTKFGRKAPIALADPQMIDLLVTDAPPARPLAAGLERLEIAVEVAA